MQALQGPGPFVGMVGAAGICPARLQRRCLLLTCLHVRATQAWLLLGWPHCHLWPGDQGVLPALHHPVHARLPPCSGGAALLAALPSLVACTVLMLFQGDVRGGSSATLWQWVLQASATSRIYQRFVRFMCRWRFAMRILTELAQEPHHLPWDQYIISSRKIGIINLI